MARCAGRGELGGHVIGVRGLLKVLHVARGAIGGEAQENSRSRAFVAIHALQRSMSAKERKTILVFADLLYRDLPAPDRVALCAIRAHFSLVDVGVTIRAVLADVGEHRLYVALRAFHLGVHAPQRVCGPVVVKLGNRADGAPSC